MTQQNLTPAAWMDAFGSVALTPCESFRFPLYSQAALDDAAEVAANMTSRCREVDYNWREPLESRYVATVWVNATGSYLSAAGPTVWQAVKAVHKARAEMEL